MIKPQESATTRRRGSPAWREHIKEYRELGYEKWRERTGYGARLPEEHTIGVLINRFGDEVKTKVGPNGLEAPRREGHVAQFLRGPRRSGGQKKLVVHR